jgi:hypothetical protein
MAELEQRLHALAADAFPAAPDVRAAVAARIAATPGGEIRAGAAPRRAQRSRRGVLALALVLVLVPTAALAAVPSTRHAILDWLGLEHVRVERVPTVPRLPPLDRSDLGRRVASVQDASRRARFAVEVPRGLGAPAAVYVTDDGIVSLTYAPRRDLPADPKTGLGLLVTELRAAGVTRYVAKLAGPNTRTERVRVGTAPGVFLSGAQHELLIERPRGVVGPLRPRLAGNALAFERGGLVIRLEGDVDRRRALGLARTLSPAGG